MNLTEAQPFLRHLYRISPRRPLPRTTLCRACIRSLHGGLISRDPLATVSKLQIVHNGRSILLKPQVRALATIAPTPAVKEDPLDYHGPIAEYDLRVRHGKLRDDEHQRSR